MKKNAPLLIVLSLLCIYVLLTLQLPQFTDSKPPADTDRVQFIQFAKEICLFAGTGLFILLVFSASQNAVKVQVLSWRIWLSGVCLVLGITTASIIIFNPTGAFTWNINNIAEKDTRLTKPYLYDQLDTKPDIIFLGTSVSYRIQAQKYAQSLALKGFNFAVLGGTSIDYYTITNLLASKFTPEKKPTIIVTEILSPGLKPSHVEVEYYKRYPLEYTKYMPLKFALETGATHLDNIFTLSSFSKIIYVEYFTWKKQWVEIDTSESDGSGIEVRPTKAESTYKKAVARAGNDLSELLECSSLNPDGQDAILKMVTLSKEKHIGLVFYRSPINNEFYSITGKKQRIYKPCEKEFNQFMGKIQTENPNIFYVDLSHYTPIASGGKALYLDSHHLNSVGSEKVLKQLTPTILDAVKYAQSKNK